MTNELSFQQPTVGPGPTSNGRIVDSHMPSQDSAALEQSIGGAAQQAHPFNLSLLSEPRTEDEESSYNMLERSRSVNDVYLSGVRQPQRCDYVSPYYAAAAPSLQPLCGHVQRSSSAPVSPHPQTRPLLPQPAAPTQHATGSLNTTHTSLAQSLTSAPRVACDIDGCGRTFVSSTDLRRHKDSVHREGRWSYHCNNCSSSYWARKDSMNRHCEHTGHTYRTVDNWSP